MSVGKLRRVAESLDAALDVRLRWNGEGLERLLDQAHAGLVEQVVVRLRAAGWVTDVEVSFSIRGERGSIDVFGFHEKTGSSLVTEVKSVVPDSQATLAGIDRKARLAFEIARARGWDCRGVARLLVVGDSTTSRRRIDALAATYRTAFPLAGRAVAKWLRKPDVPIRGTGLSAIRPLAARKERNHRDAAGAAGRIEARQPVHTPVERADG